MKEYKSPAGDNLAKAEQEASDLNTQKKLEQEASNIEEQAQNLLKQEHKIEEQPKIEPEKDKGRVPKTKPIAPGSAYGQGKLLYILSVLCLLAMIAGAYALFDLHSKLIALEEFKAETQAAEMKFASSEAALQKAFSVIEEQSLQLDKIISSNREIGLENQNLKTRLGEAENKITANNNKVSALASTLNRFESRHPDDWLIAQSFFLVSSANSMAVYSDDVEGALWDLKNADSLLVNIDNDDIIAIRRDLQKDILYLNSLPKTDIRGINFKLDSLLESIPQLPLNELSAMPGGQAVIESAGAPNASAADWKQNLLNSVKTFSSRFIEIRRQSDPKVNGFLSIEQSGILMHNLRSLLLMSKFAVLERDKASLDNNISQAKQLLETYFDHNDPKYVAAVSLMDEISAVKFASQKLSVLKSFASLKKFAGEQLRIYDSDADANQDKSVAKEQSHD